VVIRTEIKRGGLGCELWKTEGSGAHALCSGVLPQSAAILGNSIYHPENNMRDMPKIAERNEGKGKMARN
jgi:hypothetical protein